LVLPRRLPHALVAINLVGWATLLRSIAYDRWITVLMATLLLVGAAATRRGRTWGVALAFAAASWFPVATAIGIAPPWFVFVGLIGALPFALMSRAMLRFDARATVLMTGLGASLGTAGAIAWKDLAPDVFATFPSLTPSLYANHGLAVVTLLSAALVAKALRRGEPKSATIRVADDASSELRTRVSDEEAWEDAADALEAPHRARAR
jgi:hypothetical protein